MSGTNAAAQVGTWSGDYAQLRADATSLSAGASVSTSVSVDQTELHLVPLAFHAM